MTDIIKDFPTKSSRDVLKHLRNNPEVIEQQIKNFREELQFIGSENPTILAFGRDTYNILKNNMKKSEYNQLIALTHYSHRISKENYRSDTLKKIEMEEPNK